MSLPKRVDPRRIDVASIVERAVAEAEEHQHQREILDLLNGARSLETLRALAQVLRRRPGMVYDQASLERRARRRIEQAFAVAGYSGSSVSPVVLEVGCGRAENAPHVMSCGAIQYIGVDLNTSLVPDERRQQPSIDVIGASAESLPLAANTVDLAISFNVLEHVPTPEVAVREIVRVLKPGGSFVSTFGPPFNASTGPHLTRYVDLPYLHHLFSADVVGAFTGREDPYVTVNRRPLAYYRNVFFSESGFMTSRYREHVTGSGFWLLKARRELGIDLSLEELGVSAITVSLSKTN